MFHLPVHAVPLILEVVEVSAQLGDDLDMFAELDDLLLQVRVRPHVLLYLPLQTDSLLLQSLYLLFQGFHLLLVVLSLDLNVVLCDSVNNQLINLTEQSEQAESEFAEGAVDEAECTFS